MNDIHSEVRVASNIFKTKALKTIYFENSVLGKTLGLFGVKYMTSAQKVEALTLIRRDNNFGQNK